METSYLLAGGDRRQFWLSRLLVYRGQVYTLGVPGLEDSLPKLPADILILPVPCLDREGKIRQEHGSGLAPSALAGLYDSHTRIYGGALPGSITAWLPGSGPVTDLLADPAVSAANGRLTAEAALALTADRREASFFGLPCLVLGYGRIGKPLAELLSSHLAQVTVAARRPAVRAEAAQRGYSVTGFEELSGDYAVVFNTVPAPALSAAALDRLGPDCLWVELASTPGGLPETYMPRFSRLPANSLPGRRLPRSAAAVLLEGISRKEMDL